MRSHAVLLLVAAAACHAPPAAAPEPAHRDHADSTLPVPSAAGGRAMHGGGGMRGRMRADSAHRGMHGGGGMHADSARRAVHGGAMGPMHAMHGDSAGAGMVMHGRGAGGMHARRGADAASPDSTSAARMARQCPAPDPALVEQGRALFAGRGNCAACHGAAGRGTGMAPDLTDAEWLHADGSYRSLAGVIAAGVARPLRHPAPMPPRGGADLSAAEVCAVAAYVRSRAP